MIEILITVLNMSIGASIVAAAVLLARLLLKKAPKVFSYAMWGIVFLRLTFPFNFESPVSLMPIQAEIIPPSIATQATPNITSGVPAIDEPVNQFIHNTVPQVNPTASANPLQITLSIATLVWILGVAALVLYAVISYIRLKRRVYDATLVQGNIYSTDKIQTAFVLGFIRPKIYIPTSIGGAQLSHILKHEQVHVRRRDYLIKPLAFLVLAVHWFNPVVWACYFLLSKDMETSCDEAVLRKSSDDIRRDYSACLVNLYTRKPRLLSPLAFGEGSYRNMKSRINNVLKFKKPSRWTVIACLLLVAVLLVGCTTNPPKPLVPEDLAVNQPVNNAQANTQVAGPGASASPQVPIAEAATTMQSVTYEKVWMARPPIDPDFPDGVHPRPHPHIQWSVTNGTYRAIHTIQRGMLAFDKDGQPLKIHWNIFTDDENAFFYLPGDDEYGAMGLRPGETFGKENDGDGWGWSLNYDGEDPIVDEIAYVLFCDKQIVFEDGTVWSNPDFENWRATYEGQKVDVNTLENYYPYVQNVELPEQARPTELDYAAIEQRVPVQLARAAMQLDYANMTVADFNAALEEMCEEANTNVPALYDDVSSLFYVYDKDGAAIGQMYNDPALEAFVETTLLHSSVEVYAHTVGDSVTYMGSVIYMNTPDFTAMELAQKRQSMDAVAWQQYFDENIHQINIYPTVSYYIEEEIEDSGGITVLVRDRRINDAHEAIGAYILGLDSDKASSEAFEENLLGALEQILDEYSDDKMAIDCVVQSIERDGNLQ